MGNHKECYVRLDWEDSVTLAEAYGTLETWEKVWYVATILLLPITYGFITVYGGSNAGGTVLAILHLALLFNTVAAFTHLGGWLWCLLVKRGTRG